MSHHRFHDDDKPSKSQLIIPEHDLGPDVQEDISEDQIEARALANDAQSVDAAESEETVHDENLRIIEALNRSGVELNPIVFLKIRLDILTDLLVGDSLVSLFNQNYEARVNSFLIKAQEQAAREKLKI